MLKGGKLLDQEFDSEDPVTFHLGLAFFLRTQKRIFEMLTSNLPELASHGGVKHSFETYRSLDEKTWQFLEEKYASQIK